MTRLLLLLLACLTSAIAAVTLNSTAVDPSLFRVTTFISGLPLSNSIVMAADGSFLVAYSPGYSNATISRFTDNNHDGIADDTGTVVYSSTAGPLTQLREGGKYYFAGEFGSNTIRVLEPGATPGDTMTAVGGLEFSYPGGWLHPTIGMALRPTPGSAGSYDLVFNIGSQFNAQLSTNKVTVSGLGMTPVELDGDSLYMVTIDQTGASPVASNLRQVATGIRNVYGMGFHPVTGDFYFTDNAIDEEDLSALSTPPQAEELNWIAAALVGNTVPNFGYPTCYTAYQTGAQVGSAGACSGVQQPLAVFQPIPNPPAGGRSEGPTEIAFAPAAFPAGWNNGIFSGFSGKNGVGPVNDENAIAFYNFTNSQVSHFIESALPGVGNLLGVYSTNNSLFIADWGGSIYQISAEPVPEPATLPLLAASTLLLMLRRGLR